MKRNIVGVIISNDTDEREVQKQEIHSYIEKLSGELFGIIDLSYSFSIHELQQLLGILEKEGATTIIGSFTSDINSVIKEQIEKTNLEYININQNGLYKDKKYMFVVCREVDMLNLEMLVRVLADANITDIYVLIESNSCFNKYGCKIQAIAEAMNIKFHFFSDWKNDLYNTAWHD